MSHSKDASDTRQKLLQAAGNVIMETGVSHLTLEAVAKKAGVSKGGLLYHFATKEALIEGMVENLIYNFSTSLDRELTAESDDDRSGRWLRAYVKAGLQPDDEANGVSAGLIAAVATNPALLDPLRKGFAEWQSQVEASGIDAATATIIRLAVDALWLLDLLDLGDVEGNLREQVIKRLLELSEGK